MIYFVDNLSCSDEGDGLSIENAVKDYKRLNILPGDTVLFKCGSVYREPLMIVGGAEGAPVRYGAYGEGDMPTFIGSVDVSEACYWQRTERENVWECIKDIPTDVGNFVFNNDECTATLRWCEEELAGNGDFFDSRFAECNENKERTISKQRVLLYSTECPSTHYSHIEAVVYGKRTLGEMRSHTEYRGLRFKNSGVHGLTAFGDTRDIKIIGCEFLNIGGCGWSRERKIRFGNGIEFWIGAVDILIEGCLFHNIYDSCATHQGPDYNTPPARNFQVIGNTFDTYSMAAFEYRANMMIDSAFTNNKCKNAGCGFGMLGESIPRGSEIYPLPMGHHIFLWRIFDAVEGGSLLISDNEFDKATNGYAIFSIIHNDAMKQITIKGNKFNTGADIEVDESGSLLESEIFIGDMWTP